MSDVLTAEQVGGVPERAEWMETVRILREQRDAALRLAEERERTLLDDLRFIDARLTHEEKHKRLTASSHAALTRARAALAAAPPAGEAAGQPD